MSSIIRIFLKKIIEKYHFMSAFFIITFFENIFEALYFLKRAQFLTTQQ